MNLIQEENLHLNVKNDGFSEPRRAKAAFLDRDGVINIDKNYLSDPAELELIKGAADALKILREKGFLLIIVTNQSGIARGYFTEKDLFKIHERLFQILAAEGIEIDAFYYCPHRPDENCTCRKPNPGLIIKAINDFNIDLNKSWFVGDQESDFLTAKKIGCGFVQVNNSKNLKDVFKEILEFRH